MASQSPSDYSQFKSARSKARAAVRRAKNKWLVEVAEQAESSKHGGAVWSTIRAIQRCFHGLRPLPAVTLKNEVGELCKSAEEVSERWKQHFMNVLNIQSPFDISVFDSLHERPTWDELADPPTKEELARAVTRLCNNKAPGESGILPEMVHHGGDAFFSALLSLVQQVWHDRCVPQAWWDAELVPIPKKGDLSSCDNWQGIALLDIVGKLVGRLIHSRLQLLAESELTDSMWFLPKSLVHRSDFLSVAAY